MQVEYAKREQYWLEQLQAFDQWPTLFICGAHHVSSFSVMLRGAEIGVTVAAHDWPLDV